MIPSDIGQNIRQARKARGITQEQLAASLYVSRQTISSWENARTQPDYETLQKLADLLNVGVSDLFGAADKPVPEEAAPADPLPDEMPPAPEAVPLQDANPLPDAGLPVLPEVVQPEEEPSGTSRAKAPLKIAVMCILVCILAVWLFTREAAYSPEQFMKTAAPIESQAHVTLYVKDSRVNLLSGKSHPTWSYSLYLREDHGVGFQIENLRTVYFLADGQTVVLDFTASDVARMKQTSHLNGYGLMMLAPGYTPSDRNPAHPTGAGVLLEGRDDGMHAQSFTLYIPFEPYP